MRGLHGFARRQASKTLHAPRLAALLLCSSGALLALGCVEDSPHRAREITLNGFCGGYCRRLSRCYASFRAAACFDSCMDVPRPDAANGAVLALELDCLETQTCTALEQDATYDACFREAVEAHTPSSTCIEFCSSDSEASFECGGGYSVEECVGGGTCSWHDDVLTAGASCNEIQDCEERNTCLVGVFPPP